MATRIIQNKFVVNGQTYESLEAMPPEARQACEQATRAARASEPAVKKSEFKVSFQFTGPGLRFGKNSDPSHPSSQDPTSTREPRMMWSIEPSSPERAVRFALIVGGGVLVGLVLWFLTRGH